ncbi:MAG: PilZ domain-containing protein [Terriglobia bacterium]
MDSRRAVSTSLLSGSAAVQRAKNKGGFAQRAQRYELQLPLRYRELGTRAWHEGVTVNMSAAGVLFEAAQVLQRFTMVEMTVALPGVPPGLIAGRGTVVRSTEAADADRRGYVAASIRHYRFVRHRRSEP